MLWEGRPKAAFGRVYPYFNGKVADSQCRISPRCPALIGPRVTSNAGECGTHPLYEGM